MSLTSEYFEIIKNYRRAVADAQEKAGEKIRRAEKARGSELYKELIDEAQKELENAAKAARETAKPKLRIVIDKMRQNVSQQKPVPPTSEMLEKLQFLKMRFDVLNLRSNDNFADRDTITYDELKEAATFCQGNSEALKVVKDMATRKGFVLPNIKETVGGDLCQKAVDGLEKDGFTVLELPKVNNRMEYLEMSNSMIYSKDDITNGRGMDFFRVDKDFSTEKDMISEYGGLYPNNYVEATAIING